MLLFGLGVVAGGVAVAASSKLLAWVKAKLAAAKAAAQKIDPKL